jgi:hypothetical protein
MPANSVATTPCDEAPLDPLTRTVFSKLMAILELHMSSHKEAEESCNSWRWVHPFFRPWIANIGLIFETVFHFKWSIQSIEEV